MPNFKDKRRDGKLQRLSLDNGIVRANRAPLDETNSTWVERNAWEKINAQVRTWDSNVDSYAWALPISQRDEPTPKYFETEDGQRLNPEWEKWDQAVQIVDNASPDTISLYEARINVEETRTGPDGEPETYSVDRQMVLEWPNSSPGEGEVYSLTPSVTDLREAKITLTVTEGDNETLKDAADKLAYSKLDAIRTNGYTQFGDVLDAYRTHERASWSRQLEQARAFKSDNTASTPLMDHLANKRGLTRDEMATLIIARADEFTTKAGEVIGHQQSLEDQVKAAQDASSPSQVENVPEW